jgi:hypothetical protein
MPLPCILKKTAAQCHAKCKATQQQCRNPAAFGMAVCRYHGARRPNTILKGEAHPAYKHGRETKSMKASRSAGVARLRELEDLLHKWGMIEGGKTPGRKPHGK